jgi:hypothetical protein
MSMSSTCRGKDHLRDEQHHPSGEHEAVKMNHPWAIRNALEKLAEIGRPKARHDNQAHECS